MKCVTPVTCDYTGDDNLYTSFLIRTMSHYLILEGYWTTKISVWMWKHIEKRKTLIIYTILEQSEKGKQLPCLTYYIICIF